MFDSIRHLSPRWRLAMLLGASLLSLLLVAGCSIKLVADYDQASIDRLGVAYERMDRVYERLMRTEPAARTYDLFEDEWSAIGTDLRSVALRQKLREQNEESAEIAAELLSAWQSKRDAHRDRSFTQPNNAYADALIALHRATFEAEFFAAMSAERFKQ
jgi:outer membrane murein-binding lipoprotein Lpp